MKRSFYLAFVCIFTIFLNQVTGLAQSREALNSEWLAKDIEAIRLISRIMPLENQSIDHIKKVLNIDSDPDEEDLGFGAKRYYLGKGSGYTTIRIDMFLVNGQVGYYKLQADGSSEYWKQIRKKIISAWKSAGGTDFKEDDYRIISTLTVPNVIDSYKQAVSSELGEMKDIKIPSKLRGAYEGLISHLDSSYIGKVCGYGGSPPFGKQAIDILVKSKRIDLIENVLRGYSPGGRVYAVIALLEMKEQGVSLSAETQATIEKVINLPVDVPACQGCMVYSKKTAREAMRLYHEP